MAANPFNFELKKDMPVKEAVKGLEKLMPVGSRQFSLVETTGKTDARGEPEVAVTDLKRMQEEIHKEDENWNWEKGCFDYSDEKRG